MHSTAGSSPLGIARMLMERHGLRAVAVTQEHANEAQLAGDIGQRDHWNTVQAAIAELQRSEATHRRAVRAGT